VSREVFPRPRKRLGQHFLTDTRILARIAEGLELTGTETVVEIGPGRGSLTEQLVTRARRVVAIELDRELAQRLREQYVGDDRVEIVEGDVLDLRLSEVAGTAEFVLAGNVPYYITTPIIFQALRRPRPARAVYLVQREVADRMVSPPGSKVYGALSVNVQALASAEILFRVPAGAFHPPPKVESAVVRVTPLPVALIPESLEEPFRGVVQECFSYRRKQMRRIVRTIARVEASDAEGLLDSAGIDPDTRPETLTPADFARLTVTLGAR
jgi:16S rRNA (adenine1518-N6/adenine1519-N6)-dimethyltransferase